MESVYNLGDFQLQSGVVLPKARLSYATHGTLNDDRTNAIVYATRYAGRHDDNAAMIGEGRALDPTKYFIVVPDMFGNGLSNLSGQDGYLLPGGLPPRHRVRQRRGTVSTSDGSPCG